MAIPVSIRVFHRPEQDYSQAQGTGWQASLKRGGHFSRLMQSAYFGAIEVIMDLNPEKSNSHPYFIIGIVPMLETVFDSAWGLIGNQLQHIHWVLPMLMETPAALNFLINYGLGVDQKTLEVTVMSATLLTWQGIPRLPNKSPIRIPITNDREVVRRAVFRHLQP